jgi:hypothetical protein
VVIPVIPTLGKLRQEDHEFKASLAINTGQLFTNNPKNKLKK